MQSSYTGSRKSVYIVIYCMHLSPDYSKTVQTGQGSFFFLHPASEYHKQYHEERRRQDIPVTDRLYRTKY